MLKPRSSRTALNPLVRAAQWFQERGECPGQKSHHKLNLQLLVDFLKLCGGKLLFEQVHEIDKSPTRGMQTTGVLEVPSLAHVRRKLVPVAAHATDQQQDLTIQGLQTCKHLLVVDHLISETIKPIVKKVYQSKCQWASSLSSLFVKKPVQISYAAPMAGPEENAVLKMSLATISCCRKPRMPRQRTASRKASTTGPATLV